MNYYEHHLGDYQRKTAHLTLAQHGAYLLMLQIFYGTERPLPSDRKILYRLLRSASAAERNAIDAVVIQFWIDTPEGLVNTRAKQVLEDYRNWVAKQKANGSRGGRPKESDGLANGGDRARVPLPTPHLDHDLHTHTSPKPSAARQGVGVGARSVCETPSKGRPEPKPDPPPRGVLTPEVQSRLTELAQKFKS